jgi:hypothetical protein
VGQAGGARKGAAIIHVHGGWFNWGTARAFRNFAGHIASSAGVDAFIPAYRLAPNIRFLLPFGTSKRAIADWLTREPPRSPLRATRPEAIWRWCFCQLPQRKSLTVPSPRRCYRVLSDN